MIRKKNVIEFNVLCWNYLTRTSEARLTSNLKSQVYFRDLPPWYVGFYFIHTQIIWKQIHNNFRAITTSRNFRRLPSAASCILFLLRPRLLQYLFCQLPSLSWQNIVYEEVGKTLPWQNCTSKTSMNQKGEKYKKSIRWVGTILKIWR